MALLRQGLEDAKDMLQIGECTQEIKKVKLPITNVALTLIF